MRRNANWITAILLFAAPFIFFFPISLGQKVFFEGDFTLFSYPIRIVLARALAQGRLPLWEPTIAAGFPLLAEGQVGAFYPLNQILYRVLPVHIALGYEILFHLGWLMVGMFLFARSLRLGIPSAVLGAVAFMGSAAVMESLLFPTVLATMAYLPWLLWLASQVFKATRRPARARWFVLLCGAMMLQLLDAHPQYVLFNLGILFVFAMTWVWQSAPTSDCALAPWWHAPSVVVLAALIAVGVGAVQILPTLELMGLSTRGGLTYDEFTVGSVELQHLILFLAPFAQGGVYGVTGYVVGYLGVIPLLLAIAAPFIRRERRTIFWAGLALLGLAFAFGKFNPLYQILYYLPILNSLRVAGRFLYIATFAAAVLAALGFDRLILKADEQPRAGLTLSRSARLLLVSGCAALGIDIMLAHQLPLNEWLILWTWLPLILVLLGAGIVRTGWGGHLPGAVVTLAILGLTVFELIAFSAVLLQSKSALISVDEFVRAQRSLIAIPARSGESRVLTAGAQLPPFDVAKESLYPNWGTVRGIDSIKGTTGFFVRRAREYTDLFSPGMLNLANVRYLLIPKFPLDAAGRVISQPSDKFALRLGAESIGLPPTHAAAAEVESYLEDDSLADGTEIGGLIVSLDDGTTIAAPLRVGFETAAWNIELAGGRRLPRIATTFPGFIGKAFNGHTFSAQVAIPSGRAVVKLQLRSDSRFDILHIEHVRMIDARDGIALVDYIAGASNHSTVFRGDRATVIENSDVVPRAYLVHAAQLLDDATMLVRLREFAFEPRSTLFLSGGDPLDDPSSEQGAEESVEVATYAPERVVLNVKASRPGYVVLSDTWYPGWNARVDGKPAIIQRADYTFRAVRVEAGMHTIEMDYQPSLLYLGASISAFMLAVLLVGAGWIGSK
jgi:hypothetical protein